MAGGGGEAAVSPAQRRMTRFWLTAMLLWLAVVGLVWVLNR